MNRPEAEKLLGGYATGTLTDSEKQALFAAALAHQELFDALADEEALRELLADPMARARLLAVLPQPEPQARKAQKLWRRPAVLGVAASLFVLVTTGYMVWRRTGPAVLDLKMAEHSKKELQITGSAPAAESPAQGATVGAQSSPAVPRATSLAKAKGMAPRDISGAAPPSVMENAQPAETDKRRAEESQPEPVPLPQAGSVAETMAPSPKMARATKSQETPSSEGYAMSDSAVPAKPGVPVASLGRAAKVEAKQRTKSAEAGKAVREPQISSLLEHLQGEAVRLTVSWGPSGHLYVLRRSPSGVVVLPPLKSAPGKAGHQLTTFEFALGPHDLLDAYVLPDPEADPAALPASGDVQGDWRRIYPE